MSVDVAVLAGASAPASYEMRAGGWVWPVADVGGWANAMTHASSIERVVSRCNQRRAVIQAGGNCGVWPALLATHFDRVYTFEPDATAWHALVRNVPAANVYAYRAALGNGRRLVGVASNPGHGPDNCGAVQVRGEGHIPTLMIDDLAISDVDLVWLDVEGYEWFALMGGVNTIRRCKPVIVLERNGLEKGYGVPDEYLTQWLQQYGYVQVDRQGRDVVYKC